MCYSDYHKGIIEEKAESDRKREENEEKGMMKSMVKIAIGFFIIVIVLIGYIPQPEYLVELTCVSNVLGGLLLLADGILDITKKKNIPNSFYLNVAVSILVVFLVCMGSLTGIYRFNFKGAFFFMHVVDPIVFVACYLFFVNEQGRKIRSAFVAPIMLIVYLLFDYVRCKFTGEFVYGFVEPEELTYFYAISVGIVICFCGYLLGLSLFVLNRFVHKNS